MSVVKNSLPNQLWLDFRNSIGLQPKQEERMGLISEDTYDARDKLKNPQDGRIRPINLATKYFKSFPIYNQKRTNRCTGFAGKAGLALMNRRLERLSGAAESSTEFSANAIYYHARANKLQDQGAYMRDLMRVLYVYGAPSARVWKDEQSLYSPPTNLTTAPAFKTTGYQRIAQGPQQVQDIAQVLSVEELPVFIGARLYERPTADAIKHGRFSIPSDKDRPTGSHAMLIVGWVGNDTPTDFIVANSWGTDIGNKGFHLMPVQYLMEGHVIDSWTLPAITY